MCKGAKKSAFPTALARWSLWSSWSLNCFDQDVPSFGRPDCGPKIGRRFRRRECITDDAGENCEGEGGEDGEELQWTDCLLPFVECTTSTTSPPPIEGRNGKKEGNYYEMDVFV